MIVHPKDAPQHLLAFIEAHGISAEFLAPGVPMPTVARAAAAIAVPENQILKTLLFADERGQHVIAIANGTRRVASRRLADVARLHRPRAADPATVIDVTGYPAGGVAPIALPDNLPVVVDTAAAALPEAFGGGGRSHLLLRLAPSDIIRLNRATVADIAE